MAGHNKWSKIKHKKAASDAKKSQAFSKLARLITTESKASGGDVNSPGLRAAVERARAENMPRDNIERAVAKGVADVGATAEVVRYELYGPGGVAVVADGLTDNRNRTAAEIKHLVSKLGYELAAPGAATWAFTQSDGKLIPQTTIALAEADCDKLAALIDALEAHDDVLHVVTNAA